MDAFFFEMREIFNKVVSLMLAKKHTDNKFLLIEEEYKKKVEQVL